MDINIEKEREKLITQINKYGCSSSKVLKQSQKCDKLIFEIMKKKLEKKVKIFKVLNLSTRKYFRIKGLKKIFFAPP